MRPSLSLLRAAFCRSAVSTLKPRVRPLSQLVSNTRISSKPSTLSLMLKPPQLSRLMSTSVDSVGRGKKWDEQWTEAKKHAANAGTVLEAPATARWQEVPVGGIYRGPDIMWKIWYNHAVVPIFAVIGIASVLCGWFLWRCVWNARTSPQNLSHPCVCFNRASRTSSHSQERRRRYSRYFTAHTEIAWTKELRGTFDHQGLDSKGEVSDKHDRRLLYPGIRDVNKKQIKIFPFNFVPMEGARGSSFRAHPSPPLVYRVSRLPRAQRVHHRACVISAPRVTLTYVRCAHLDG